MAKKILMADDEPEFVELVKFRLESNGYDVVTASNGKEAVEKAKTQNPDIILLDILMPDMDGYTALRELKGQDITKDIPVIIITAKTGMKDLFAIDGIRDYLIKPFDDEDLLLRIKRALGYR